MALNRTHFRRRLCLDYEGTLQCTADWVVRRVAALSFSGYELAEVAGELGFSLSVWNTQSREIARVELDALLFHLFGLSRGEAAYVMDTFPIVRRNDLKDHGEFRTKRLILEVYDELAEAIRTGTKYQTRLAPPPASGAP